jgi:hypothetical protein
MPLMGFEPATPVSEKAKICGVLDRPATVIGTTETYRTKIQMRK